MQRRGLCDGGRLAATFDCEVRENISGVVVVRRGDIRTRNIIDKAYVISKQGTVHCRHSQAPDLVFAGREIRIEDAAIMGCYVSPRIQVGGEAYGGEFHASESVAAEQFRRSDTRELALVLRRDISCRDYGETPDENASNLMATAAQLRRRIRDLATQARFADRESEQCAATAVVHLVGGKAKEAAVERPPGRREAPRDAGPDHHQLRGHGRAGRGSVVGHEYYPISR